MTSDDARKLLAAYATGSLTEAERNALFEAALEDQDLFDELAAEQALKEVLDQPGARQRLLRSLEEQPALEPPSGHRAWLWAGAAATVAVAVVIGIVVSQRTPPPQQIAQVLKSPEPANTPTAAPVAEPAPVRRKVAPVPAPQPEPQPPVKLKKEEREADQLADRLQEVKPQAAVGAVRGFVAGPAPAAAARQALNEAVSAATGFAFNYAVRPDGFLQIVPTAPGFLSVSANSAVVFPSGAISAGMPLRIPIPSDATSLVISFSRTPEITGSPVRRDESSGTVTDQDPPNGKVLIELFLTPGTR
jgi:outer membrane biosynthesis protein TonB